MATATKTQQPDISDRWRTLMIDVDSFDAEPKNSETYRRLSNAIREIAGRMIHGIEGASDGPEYNAFANFEQQLLSDIEDRVKAFALEIEISRVPSGETRDVRRDPIWQQLQHPKSPHVHLDGLMYDHDRLASPCVAVEPSTKPAVSADS